VILFLVRLGPVFRKCIASVVELLTLNYSLLTLRQVISFLILPTSDNFTDDADTQRKVHNLFVRTNIL